MTLQLYYSVPILSSVNFVTAIWFILCNELARGEERERERERERTRQKKKKERKRRKRERENTSGSAEPAAGRLNCEPRKM